MSGLVRLLSGQLAVCVAVALAAKAPWTIVDQSPPDGERVEPQIFSAGVISSPANDGSPTFTPDSKTLFFAPGGAAWTVILDRGDWGKSYPSIYLIRMGT
jgi:WD40-like Beta Propeller Repeat